MGEEEYDLVDGPFGKTLKLHVEWSDDLLHLLTQNDIQELSLRKHRGSRWDSLSFLDSFSQIKGFTLLAELTTNISPIHKLLELRKLHFLEYSEEPIDFFAFQHLRECNIYFSKNRISVSQCTSLMKLHLHGYSYKSLNPLKPLNNLTTLDLVQGPLEDLGELPVMSNLTSVNFAYLRKLTNISPLSSLKSLESLRITNCKGISNLDAVSNLKNLRTLSFSNCGEIESLVPITHCQELEAVNFTDGTIVKDGRISELMKLPKLRRVGFANRKHYDRTLAELLMYTQRSGSK